jgi:Zn finger protein HypA/HybF involved in hydrogenase expression
MKKLITALNAEAEKPEVGDVKKIHIEVGELAHITPEIIEHCFSHMPKNEKLRNAKIELSVIPLRVGCGQKGAKVTSGNEFILKSIEW